MEIDQPVLRDHLPTDWRMVFQIARLGRAHQFHHGRVHLLHCAMQLAGIVGAAVEAIPERIILDVVFSGWHVHHLLVFC